MYYFFIKKIKRISLFILFFYAIIKVGDGYYGYRPVMEI